MSTLNDMNDKTASVDTFEELRIAVGTIISADSLVKTKIPSIQLSIDFGVFGMLNSSAQLTELYQKEDLLGKQIIAVINFPVKMIAGFKSECLVLGAVPQAGIVSLLSLDYEVPNGTLIS